MTVVLTELRTLFARHRGACHLASVRYLILICMLIQGCSSETPPPQLGTKQERPKADAIRLGGSILVTPIVRRMARLFVEQSPGQAILVESSLDPDGAQMAQSDGLLDGALVVDPIASKRWRTTIIARSKLVLALGTGIEARSFDQEGLRALADGSNGVGSAAGRYFPPRERELLRALSYRHMGIAKILERPELKSVQQSLDYGRPLWEQVAAVRGGYTLADSGNLRLFGPPVWIGELSDLSQPFISFGILTAQKPPARLQKFLEYVASDAGEMALREMGFQRDGRAP
jgi:hypothetical protein